MQKLLKRTAQAEKQAARRIKKRNDLVNRAAQRQDFRKRMSAVRDANASLTEARQRRRDDWELGPLAPQRDTPVKGKTGAYWGSLSLTRTMSDLPDKQIELACKWAGGRKYLCIKAGDRVAIMQGPDKGKIGTIRTIVENEGTVMLDGEQLQQNYTVSEFISKSNLTPETTFVQLSPLRVPIQAVRLVHPLRDPKTGQVRDVIINELTPTGILRDKPTGRVTWSRAVPGLNVEIPWPRDFEDAERNELENPLPDHDCDTLRIDVEQNTFVPTLLSPPMPAEILDELRNKYSKFRTRHEPEYIAKKEAEEAAKIARRKGYLEMMTPVQELNARIREEKKQRPVPVLTDGMLEKIGQVMARNAYRAPALKKVPEELVSMAQRSEEKKEARSEVRPADLAAPEIPPESTAPPPS
ncbi:hypothetical protein M406DRAFT_257845 [Cryphonectria parasitica EP155]|uniref:KOW domain-containing protein n=1 Tax=Cryphonectria parasitica (strain ATCC 38755 / EP155) TaxID=660469 RepID=A0A9P5CNV3_CRYP1|nr:uncharacterized protein M406DRAFT_257845 [Cryphonectria parasitica EP155]KAF3765859.1 hypothetical protein M406DRAFT_257845 [Cryphonectria parasitica EP155]